MYIDWLILQCLDPVSEPVGGLFTIKNRPTLYITRYFRPFNGIFQIEVEKKFYFCVLNISDKSKTILRQNRVVIFRTTPVSHLSSEDDKRGCWSSSKGFSGV